MTATVTKYCPAAHDRHRNATIRCNLLPGHVGLHDDGLGEQWGDDTTTEGPDRLQTAAVNLIGSMRGIHKLRTALRTAVGASLEEAAIQAVGDVLRRWAEGEDIR